MSAHPLAIGEYSVTDILTRDEHPDVYSLLAKYAPHLRVPDYVDPALGFNKLGVMLGVQDNIPDAALPILWAAGPVGWQPLMERIP